MLSYDSLCINHFFSHRLHTGALFLLLFACGWASFAATTKADDPNEQSVPNDTCILELNLPPGATLTVDGRGFGTKRRLVYRGLRPARTYKTRLELFFVDGSADKQTVLIEGGWRIRVASAGRTANCPVLVRQRGHASAVTCAALSPDGRYLLTGSDDQTAILWHVADKKVVQRFTGHTGEFHGVAFNPNGHQVLTAAGGTAMLWNMGGDRPIRTFRQPNSYIGAIAFSPDGRWVLTSAGRGAVLWDTATGQRIRTFPAPTHLASVAFSPDGSKIAAGCMSAPHNIYLWDAATGRRLRTLEGHKDIVNALAFSPDGSTLASAGGSTGPEPVYLWDVATGRQIRRLTGHGWWLASIAFDPSGRKLAACTERAVIVWDVASGEIEYASSPARGFLNLFPGLDLRLGSLNTVGFQATDPSSLVIVGAEKVVWKDTASWKSFQKCRLSAEDSTDYSCNVACSYDGHRLLGLFGKRYGYGYAVWDTRSGQPVRQFPCGVAGTGAISPTGQLVAIVNDGGKDATVWDLESGKPLCTLHGHDDEINAIAFSPDGRSLLTGAEDKIAILWDAKTGQRLQTLKAHSGAITCVAFSPKGQEALTASAWDNTIVMWQIYTGKRIRSFKASFSRGPDAVAFSPDGSRVVAGVWGGTGGRAVLWDVQTGSELQTFENLGTSLQSAPPCVAFDPVGRRVLTGWIDRTIVWDGETGAKLRILRGHAGWVRAAVFSRDGRHVLTAASNGTVRVWDYATGRELAKISILQDTVNGQADWLVTTPEGLFDGSEAARESLMYRVGGSLKVVPVDRFFQDFYYPGLLAAIWRGERPLPEVEMGQSLPPRVRIVDGPPGGTVDAPQVTVEVEVVDQGGGVRGPWLVQNGARVLVPGQTAREGKTVRRTFDVTLVEGENKLEFYAASADGSWESEPAVITLQYDRPLPKPQLYLLAAGVSDYADDALDLQFARGDALAMAELFRQRGAALYEQVHVSQLVDQQVTATALLEALGDLARRTRSQDTLAVFLAGHGTVAGGQYYFLPHEFRRRAEKLEEDVRRQGIRAGQLQSVLETARALKRMLVFDTGQSGRPIGLAGTARDPFAFRGAIERLSRATGTYIIASAAVSDEAQEVAELGHGVLSYTLLAGLHAAGGGPLKDRWIKPSRRDRVAEALEWFGFASTHVRKLTRQYFGRSQDLQYSIAGMSFPVLPVPESAAPVRPTDSVRAHRPAYRPQPTEVEPGVGPSRLFVLAVGINRYADEAMNLEFARRDAEAMAELFRQRGKGSYREVRAELVLDEQATKAGIVEAIQKLAGLARPEDTLAVFLAGHGKMVGQRYYFIGHEFRRQADDLEEDIRQQGLPADVLADGISKVAARKRILIIDTCASGGALRLSRQGQDPFAFRGAIEKLGQRQGVFTIAAAGAGEEAQEIEDLGHGVLTYALLAALDAVPPGGPLEGLALHPTSPDGRVDVLEWFSFAAGHVPRLTRRYLGQAQEVHLGGQGASFRILSVGEPRFRSPERGNL